MIYSRSAFVIQACVALLGGLLVGSHVRAQSVPTAPSAEQQKAEHEYSEMLARVQQGDMTVDFRAFRVAGALRSGPHASQLETEERTAFRNITVSGDWTGALDSAKRALDRNYASPIAHFDAMVASQKLQQADEAAVHEKILNALLDSIRQSGDGKSPETAYFVVAVQEEYIFLNRVLHLQGKSQSWVRKDGHFYDRLLVLDPATNQTQYLWFNADFDSSDAVAKATTKDGVLATMNVIRPGAAPGALPGLAQAPPDAPSQAGASDGNIPRSGQFHLTDESNSESATALWVTYSLSGTYTVQRDYVAVTIESGFASASREQPSNPVLHSLQVGVCYQSPLPSDGGRWFGPLLSPQNPALSLNDAVLKAGQTYKLPPATIRIPLPKIPPAPNWLCSLVMEKNGRSAYYAHDAGRPNLISHDLLARRYSVPAQPSSAYVFPNPPAYTSADPNLGVPPNTTILDNFNGSSAGQAFGVTYVQLPGAQPSEHGASFSQNSHSRIEYRQGIPSEGTLEWWINVANGYSYHDFRSQANEDQALIFSTDSYGGDVTWPGAAKLFVSANGDVSLFIATSKYNQPPVRPIEFKGTPFRFNSWHAVGVSYGSQGELIMVDGRVMASAPAQTQTLGAAGNHQAPLDIPTIGETVSHFWALRRYDGGFNGTVALFRASSAQKDWYLARGVTPDFRQPNLSSPDQSALQATPPPVPPPQDALPAQRSLARLGNFHLMQQGGSAFWAILYSVDGTYEVRPDEVIVKIQSGSARISDSRPVNEVHRLRNLQLGVCSRVSENGAWDISPRGPGSVMVSFNNVTLKHGDTYDFPPMTLKVPLPAEPLPRRNWLCGELHDAIGGYPAHDVGSRPLVPSEAVLPVSTPGILHSATKHAVSHEISERKPELILQTGHANAVTSVAYSPDGRWLASGSEDQTVILWDPATRHELRSLSEHVGPVRAVAISPDGRRLAAAGGGISITIWDVETGREIRTITGDTTTVGQAQFRLEVETLAFSRDGVWLASGNWDGQISLWEVDKGREVRTFDSGIHHVIGGGARTFASLALSPNGELLASAANGTDGVNLWNIKTGKQLPLCGGQSSPTTSVAFSLSGQGLATGSKDGTVKLWDVPNGKEVHTLSGHTGAITDVTFSPDGLLLASASEDKTVKLWDPTAGRELRSLAAHSGSVTAVAFSPDGLTLVSASVDKTLKLWEVKTGQVLRSLTGSFTQVSIAAFSHDGHWGASAGEGGTVRVWDSSSGKQAKSLQGNAGWITGLDISPDGHRLASAGNDGTLSIWELSSGRQVLNLHPTGDTNSFASVAFSADGNLLAWCWRQRVKVYDPNTGGTVQDLQEFAGFPLAVAFSHNGRWLAAGNTLWDLSTGKKAHEFRGHIQRTGPDTFRGFAVGGLAFSPDDRLLASAGDDGTIILFDVETGQELRTFHGHTAQVRGVKFSPDGRWLVSAGWDKLVKVWEVATGQTVLNLVGHTGRVNSASFEFGARWVVSAGSDGTVRIWDPKEGELVATLLSLREGADWLVVTPDGLFDGSNAAWGKVLWRFSSSMFDVAPVERFFNEFYYPGLLADILAGKGPKAPQHLRQRP